VALLNPADFPYLFPVASRVVTSPALMLADLLGVLGAAAEAAKASVPAHLARAASVVAVGPAHRDLAAALMTGEKRAVWLGALAQRHPAWADLRAAAVALADITGASLGILAEGGNAAGAWLAGAVPHREAGGQPSAQRGLDARAMFEQPQRAYLLFGGIEPSSDLPEAAAARAQAALSKAACVIAVTPFVSDELRALAHILLPMGSFAETSGTYVSLDGTWQSVPGAARAVGEARPGWKILRVLGNLTGQAGFDYQSSEEVRDELRGRCEQAATAATPAAPSRTVELQGGTEPGPTISDVAIYGVDALVRRAPALQATRAAREPVQSW
jgi:NADH-quinone oxidoreductase subunit G